MPGDNELEIVLNLVDNASKELKKIMADVKKDTEGVSKESEKAAGSLKEGMKDAGKSIKEFRREMFVVTLTFTSLYLAVKEYAKYNVEASQSVLTLEKNINLLKIALGGLIVEYGKAVKSNPIGAAIINPFQPFFDMLKSVGNPEGSFQDTMNKASRMQDSVSILKAYKQALQDIDTLYLTGQITAQQYYDKMSSNTVADMQNQQMRMQLLQQLSAQENMMRNQDLMNYQADIQARMGLLKTLQSYHHTMYSTMMDFANMTIQKFTTGMTTALTSIIMGTKKAGEAFKEFGISMVTAIVEFVIQYGIQMLIAAALSKIIMASTIAQASAVASAWLPAAMWASIATLGAADAAGAAGFAAASGAMMGTSAMIKVTQIALDKSGNVINGSSGYAEGGWINEPIVGVGASGKRYTFGEEGPEYVIPNNRLNGGGNYFHIEINYPQVRSDEDIDKITEEVSQRIAREVER